MIEITNEQREVLKLAIEIYGERSQTDIIIEEMSELTKALLKLRRATDSGQIAQAQKTDHIEEEMGDVAIMLTQLEMIFDADNVQKWANAKIDRLARRLHGEV